LAPDAVQCSSQSDRLWRRPVNAARLRAGVALSKAVIDGGCLAWVGNPDRATGNLTASWPPADEIDAREFVRAKKVFMGVYFSAGAPGSHIHRHSVEAESSHRPFAEADGRGRALSVFRRPCLSWGFKWTGC
jgi:hypothetical protein